MTVKALPAATKFAYSLSDLTARGFGGRTTLYKDINRGKLRAKKQGNRTIVLHDDAMEYAASLPDYVPRSGADADAGDAEPGPESVAEKVDPKPADRKVAAALSPAPQPSTT